MLPFKTMTSLETLIESIRHSPRLLDIYTLLGKQIETERTLRQKFYAEMTPEQKAEFIDGEIILHSPARNQHLDVTKYALKLLDTYVSIHNLGTVKVEKCLCVFPRNDYEPDIVYFGEEKTAQLTPDTLKFPVPDFAVEVLSASTEQRDRGVKFEDFAAHGVGEYWIIDAEKSFIEQYLLNNGIYDLATKSTSGQLTSQVIPGFQVPIEAFFDEKENLAALRQIMVE
jgi:Uma2 family endonuclease